jgi:peptide/nickel transport system permease protein
LSVLFIAIPGFWLGMLIVLALLFWFGYKAPIIIVHLWQSPMENLQIVIGPALVLGLAQGAYIARMSRSCLLEVISDDFVRTARAKGLTERRVMLRHSLRMSMVAFISLFGLDFGALVGGAALLTEVVYGLNGVGMLTYLSLKNLDLPVIMATVMYAAFFVVLVNAIVDLVYAWLDPRVRIA